ncbi:MAG: DUF5689 domain-containing protein, partial [Bacteroidota bacterium]
MKWRFLLFGIAVAAISCATNEFETPNGPCAADLKANTSFGAVKALYKGGIVQVQDDLILEGYVVSSDHAGNFYNVLHLQNKPIDATAGLQLEIDLRDSYLRFPEGCKVFVKLKGLYLGQRKGSYVLGGAFTAFGAITVGRLPALAVGNHLFTSCDDPVAMQPTFINLHELDTSKISTLVAFEGLEVVTQELDSTFALAKHETERTLVNCLDDTLTLFNSGYSDFQAQQMPKGKGVVKGVLLQENGHYFLTIRDLNDIDMHGARCAEVITEFTSTEVFFSELADPDNNTGARFVELYNAGNTPIDLNKWSIRRYTNDNTDVSATIDLSGLHINSHSALVIASDPVEFEQVYGFTPHSSAGKNSPADSNGDDNLELVDPFGEVIDVFGIVGEDGSGTNHEFEDGRAFR